RVPGKSPRGTDRIEDPMSPWTDRAYLALLAGVLGLLVTASILGWLLARVVTPTNRAMAANVNARIRSWWVMALMLAAALATGRLGSILLFSAISFLALREFVTL